MQATITPFTNYINTEKEKEFENNLSQEISINFEDYQKNLLFSFLSCDTKNKDFQSLYKDRKKILTKISKDQINDYIINSRKFDPEKQIFYLTNTTNEEKFEIHATQSESFQEKVFFFKNNPFYKRIVEKSLYK